MKYFFRSDVPQRVVEQSLSPLQYEVLDALAKRNRTKAQLSEELHITRQRIAYNVRALQRRGMVSPGEGRGLVRITESGKSTLTTRPLDPTVADRPVSGGQ